MKTTKKEMKALQQQLVRVRAKLESLHLKESFIEDALDGCCDHSETEPWRWEHDSGYGVQSWITGLRCSYCGKVDYWKNRRFVDPCH